MIVFLLLSAVNVAIAGLLFYVAITSLHRIHCVAVSQHVAPVAILAVAMMVLHMIAAITHHDYGVGDITARAWRVVDMLTMLALIRLVKLVH